MFLIRIIVIIAIVMALIPVINKAIEYFDEKSHKVKIIGNSAKQIWNSSTGN
jgi:hypothetical protein